MYAKLTMPLAFLGALGCAGSALPANGPVPHLVAAAPPAANEPVKAAEAAAPPAETLGQADRLYGSQLGASRAGQFEVDRQINELRRAVLLYKQFIERADGQPELSAAVRKSRERIVDACDTIAFLLADPAAVPPHVDPGC